MTIVSREDRDGIAVLTWDQPGAVVNSANKQALTEFISVMSGALDDPAVSGIVIASGKKGFIAGGDLRELQATKSIDAVVALIADALAMKRRMETGGKPIVAAVNGATMGGGLEFALACHARVADTTAVMGLPEVGLGLMPGAGGTQRLPRLIGLAAALPLLTDGKPVRAARALEMGLVSQVVERAGLVDAAVALARVTAPVQPWDVDAAQGARVLSDEDEALLEAAEKTCARRSGEMDVAEAVILKTVRAGLRAPFDAAMQIETAAFCQLPISKQAKNRIRTMFFAMNDANAIRCRPADVPHYNVRSVAVVGGGTMGGGIAFMLAQSGVDVILIEVSPEALDRGMAAIGATGDRQVKAGRMSAETRDAILARIRPQVGYDGLGGVDAAIEAVVEIEAVKSDVFAKLSAAMRPGVPIASNTSTLPITGLAAHCVEPRDFIGLHFFGPVERMPLVEVIRGRKTTDTTLARALDLLKVMRKTPVVVNDGLGFFTSRVVATYTGEALTMLAEGIDPTLIDRAATEFGMVIGPCTMADMTGLDVLINILKSAYSDAARISIQGSRAMEALQKLVDAGRTGRRGGAGIYDYDPNGRAQFWAGRAALFPAEAPVPDIRTVKQRLMHGQALETIRAMEEGIVTRASDADVGSVIGWMFPKGYGGVLSYVDTLGAARFVQDCDALKAAHGVRFDAPRTLREMAASGATFHAV